MAPPVMMAAVPEAGAAYLFSELESDPGPTPEPENAVPTASIAQSCFFRPCEFDGYGSADSDGSIVSCKWYFGEGSTAEGINVSHTTAPRIIFLIGLAKLIIRLSLHNAGL